jgi:DNA sulfur modification protein DndE
MNSVNLQIIRISEDGRNSLMTLKRRTGIPTWNILCRWAFCISLAEKTPLGKQRQSKNSTIEMTWHTFAGEYADVYLALLRERCRRDGLKLTENTLTEQLRLHIHRGIGYLVSDPEIDSISGLIKKTCVDV